MCFISVIVASITFNIVESRVKLEFIALGFASCAILRGMEPPAVLPLKCFCPRSVLGA